MTPRKTARRRSKKQQNPAPQQQRRDKANSHLQNPTTQQQQHRDAAKSQVQQRPPQQRQQRVQNVRSNAFSGNDSRSPSWEAQRQRGAQSRSTAHLNTNQRAAAQQRTGQHRELRHR
ncbi:Uncharacterised protein [Raoultella planticola]|uniref:Uncharacterized protein n=1 Tax=Raoultella planticola TaxID=575 RepID=A0A485B2E1_RAOPL|nr:Uncharacterised protein [Raoultella planticola]